MIRIDVSVSGMMCQRNCGTTVQKALLSIPGVVEAEAVYAERRASAVFVDDNSDGARRRFHSHHECLSLVLEAIEDVGFDACEIVHVEAYLAQLQDDLTMKVDSEKVPMMESVVTTSQQPRSTAQQQNDSSSRIQLSVTGMSCAVCTGRVENALLHVPGVQTAAVVLATHRAMVEVMENQVHRQQAIAQDCVRAILQQGYGCDIVQQDLSLTDNARQLETARITELHMWRRLLVISVIFTIPLNILDYYHASPFVLFLLSSIVQLGVGKRFYHAAYQSYKHSRTLGMDFLVMLGTTASYVYSIIVMILHWTGNATTMTDTFDMGATLLTFVTLGKFLESYAKGKTASALQALMELQPIQASKIVVSSQSIDQHVDLSALETIEVELAQVQVGDHLRVLPGGRIPTDGMIVAVSGHAAGGLLSSSTSAYVDESALSGEPFPVAKLVGDAVFGSTINQLSVLVVQVTAVGSSTVLSKIVRLMEDAQRNKAPIQAYADRVAGIFAPMVIVFSMLTLAGWILFNTSVAPEERFFVAFMSAIAVVVVACPCALGLATPTAVMVGTGVGAKQGLLIKGGAALENLHSIDTIVLDKTGTLTTSKATLRERIDFIPMGDEILTGVPSKVAAQDVTLWLAACVEAQSEHPLAKAVVNAAKSTWGGDVTCASEGTRVDEFKIVPGMGVECLVSKKGWGAHYVRVGSRDWAKAPHHEDSGMRHVDATGDEEFRELGMRGRIAVYLSVLQANGSQSSRRVVSVIGIVDPIALDAKSTVAALKNMGIDVWLCTGDSEHTAKAVAREIGIDDTNVCASVTPQGKAELVSRLQNSDDGIRYRVAVVGDGINDAVAITQADVGIALGAGTHIAVEAADVVLVRSSLHDVVVAIHLSKVVFRRIVMNFVWALSYNLLALPFAAGVFYPFTDFRLPPEFAGLMMAFSSVSVVTSSLLLRNYRSPRILQNGDLEGGGGIIATVASFCSSPPARRRSQYAHVPTKHVDVELV